MKLNIITDSTKEKWFVENKFNEAYQHIGEERFSYIVKCNIPDIHTGSIDIIKTEVVKFIEQNQNKIADQIENEKGPLQKSWKKYEKDFFQQISSITDLKWKHTKYNCFLLFSCFWGGDYDLDAPNIYINPLLELGDPLYVIFHELSHLLYFEYIASRYGQKYIHTNLQRVWELSEIMVNYPLVKLEIDYKFDLIIPPEISWAQEVVDQFDSRSFTELIDRYLTK